MLKPVVRERLLTVVTLLLAFLPYLLLRGPAARVARRWVGQGAAKGTR